jgi:hypothetical protein
MKKRETIALVAALLMVTSITGLALAAEVGGVAPQIARPTPTPTPTPVEDPTLWVVPDQPTRYINSSPNQLLDQTIVEDVNMGTEFSANVLVLHKAGSVDPAQDVSLKFFVLSQSDAQNIINITVGTAQRIEYGVLTEDPNDDADPNVKILTLSPVTPDPPFPTGYGASYLIGDIPQVNNGDNFGNPQDDLATFNPDNASCYIKIPFTVYFTEEPYNGFVLGVYAENSLTGKDKAHTAYSHDAGYYQEIPEFATIAMPVAGILGLFLFFNHRKRKQN